MKHFSMKRNIFSKCLYGMMALGLLASCSNEPLLEDTNDKVLENETTTYIRISLMGEGIGSRASADNDDESNYVPGEQDENAVNSLLLAFYDSNRKLIAFQDVDLTKASSSPGTGGTVEKVLSVVTPVNLPEKANHPAWVVAFVNPTSTSNDLEVPLETLMSLTRQRNSVSSQDGYRTMNNSVYFDEKTGRMRYAKDVNFPDQFYRTEEEATASNAKSIEITVERVEAKVQSSLPKDNVIAGVPANNMEYTLQFKPQAWFVNATEKRTFLIKNYRSERKNWREDIKNVNAATYSMSFSELTKAFEDGRKFNSENFLRSFWAIDPTYFVESGNNIDDFYPDVSYDVKYSDKVNPDANTYTLLYRSFTDALKEYQAKTDTRYVKFNGDGGKSHEYVLENTMSLATLTGTDAMASMTSVELIGYYVVKKGNEVVFDGSQKTDGSAFYIRNEGSATTPSYRIMINDHEAINYFLDHAANMLYVQQLDKTTGDPIKDQYVRLNSGRLDENNTLQKYGVTYADFGLIYPDTEITGSNKDKRSEQWRTLTLKKTGEGDTYNKKLFIFDSTLNNEEGGYRNITEADMAYLATSFYNTFGVVERFHEGKAHFTVPLKHIWGVDEDKTNNAFDASDVKLGDYGVVRNHVYNLTINSIKGLGTGIGDPDQPIVPPTSNQQYYISTKLNILKWRLVNQNVDL